MVSMHQIEMVYVMNGLVVAVSNRRWFRPEIGIKELFFIATCKGNIFYCGLQWEHFSSSSITELIIPLMMMMK